MHNTIYKIEGGSHLVNIDQPGMFNQLLKEFADGIYKQGNTNQELKTFLHPHSTVAVWLSISTLAQDSTPVAIRICTFCYNIQN
ncbi:MAG: hypothetical protein ABI172_04620 [Ginsengibacter sp.]